MSEISIGLTWKLGDGKMTPENYSNVHEITFTPKIKITADSAPDWRGNVRDDQVRRSPVRQVPRHSFRTLLHLWRPSGGV